jgi:hypothetical protein
MFLNVWKTHIILTSKLQIHVNTFSSSKWHFNIGNIYYSSRSMDHLDTHCRYVANVKICTYGSYGRHGTYVFYGIWSSFSNFAYGSHINGDSLENVHTCIHICYLKIFPC